MKNVVILLVALALAAGAYVWFDREDGAPDGPGLPDGTRAPTVADDAPPASDGGLATGTRPGEARTPEMLALKSPARALFVARYRTSFTVIEEESLEGLQDLQYRTWYLADPTRPDATSGVAGPGRGLAPLTEKPDAEFLEREDIQLLVFDQADPNAFPEAFWDVAGERVRSGRMGLFLRPGFPANEAGQGQSAHPALSHPVLADLLPVARALPLEGTPVPGTFTEPQRLVVTQAGVKHPATRFVRIPEASKDIWTKAGEGDGALSSVFAYPVAETRPGAQVLVELQAATPIPAIIATTGRARVLWMGAGDFGHRTYFVKARDVLQRTLLNHTWIWLLGQADE